MELLVFYVYLWLRTNGIPYYVGKGKGNRGFTSKAHRVKRPPYDENIIVQEYESEKDAFEAEAFFISYYGRVDLGTGCLANLTYGGDGSSGTVVSLETRKKQSIFQKGRPKSEEHRKKIGLGHKGKPKSKEQCAKMREVNLGKKASEETKRKLCEARARQKRGPCSEETKRKISLSLMGKPGAKRSEESRKKMSLIAKEKGFVNRLRKVGESKVCRVVG